MLSSKKIDLIPDSIWTRLFYFMFNLVLLGIFFVLPAMAYVILSKSLVSIIILILALIASVYICLLAKKSYVGRRAYIDLENRIILTVDKGLFKFQFRKDRFGIIKKISLKKIPIKIINVKYGDSFCISIETNSGTYDLGKYGKKAAIRISQEISTYYNVPVDDSTDGQPDTIVEQKAPAGLFQPLIEKIKNTEAYQIFFVRAQENSFSKGLTFLFIICSIVGHFGLVGFLNPPLRIDEMKITQGYNEGGRHSSPSIKIRNEKGEIEKFYVLIINNDAGRQKLRSIKGELITIRYYDGIDLLLFPEKYVYEIIYKNISIHKSSTIAREMLYEGGKIIFPLCAVTGFMSLFIVYLRHRRE